MHSHFNRQTCLFLCIAVCFQSVAALAQEPNEAQSEAYRTSVAQENLKQDTAAVQAQLALLREEMRQVLPGEIATIDKAIKNLESLSREQMGSAIKDLRAASQTGDLAEQVKNLAGALKNQTSISSNLKKMSVDLVARQSIERMNPKLLELLRRQITANNEVLRLAKKNPDPTKLETSFKRRYELVCGDQDTLIEDVKTTFTQIDDLARNLPEQSRPPMQKASETASGQKLIENAAGAAQLVHRGPLDQAAGTQKSVVKTLWTAFDALRISNSVMDRLRALSNQIGSAIADQKGIVENIGAIRRSDAYAMLQRQREVSDQSSLMYEDVVALNSRAAAGLRQAQTEMENTISSTEGRQEERQNAARSASAALVGLETAKKEIDKQIQEIPPTLTPQQALAALDQLQRETALAAAEQARAASAAKTPNSPFAPTQAQKDALQAKVADLQQKALNLAPEAAPDLGQASQDMAKPDAASQQAAADDLARAAQNLARQEATAKAETNVEKAAQATTKAEQMLDANQTQDAVNQLAAAKQALAAAQQAAAASTANAEAKQAMAQAAQALTQAQMAAAQTKAQEGQAAAEAAKNAMGAAMKAMGAGPPDPTAKNTPENDKENAEEGPSGGKGGNGLLAGSGAQGAPPEVITGLSPRERDAVDQLQTEKPPREFVPEVQQYYKNLADGAGL